MCAVLRSGVPSAGKNCSRNGCLYSGILYLRRFSSQKMFGVRQLNHVPTESDHARHGVVQDDSIVSIDDGSDNVANPVGQGQSPRLTSRQYAHR